MKIFSIIILMCFQCAAQAGLQALDDNELASVDGAGLGFALEDFAYESGSSLGSGNVFDIGGIRGGINGSISEAILRISRLYIAGAGSARGSVVMGNGVGIGSVDDPYSVAVIDGYAYRVNDKALLQIAAPEKSGSLLNFVTEARTERRFPGRPLPTPSQRVDGVSVDTSYAALNGSLSDWADVGITFDLNIGGINAQSLQAHATGVNIDGTRLQLWGNNGDVLGNLDLNIFMRTLEFQACAAGQVFGPTCGQSVLFNNFVLEGQLGYGDDQPLNLSVLPDGNFELELGSIEGKNTQFYNQYYSNGPRIDLHVGELRVGNTTFGSSTVANLQIQYLNIRSRDL